MQVEGQPLPPPGTTLHRPLLQYLRVPHAETVEQSVSLVQEEGQEGATELQKSPRKQYFLVPQADMLQSRSEVQVEGHVPPPLPGMTLHRPLLQYLRVPQTETVEQSVSLVQVVGQEGAIELQKAPR